MIARAALDRVLESARRSREGPHQARLHARPGLGHAAAGPGAGARRARRSSGSTSPTARPRTTPRRWGSCATWRRRPERPLAVLADLPGPKVRLGRMSPDPFRFVPGQRFDLRPGEAGRATGRRRRTRGSPRTSGRAIECCSPTGRWSSRSSAIEGEAVAALECVRGGTVRSGQGVNVPAERLGLPAVTDRDREGLARALEMGVDLVAQSFVRGPATSPSSATLMGDRLVPIVAKIETKPAIEHIGAILDVTDALMVARGDLGVELPMEQIPLLQKDLLRGPRGGPPGDRRHPDARVDDPRAAADARRGDRRRERGARRRRRDHALGRDRDRRVPVRGRGGGHEDRGGRRGARATGTARPSRRAGTRARRRPSRTRRPSSRRDAECGDHVLHGDRPHRPPALGRAARDARSTRSCPTWPSGGATPAVGRDDRSPPTAPADTDEMIELMDAGLREHGLVGAGRVGRDGGVLARRPHDHEHAEDPPGRRPDPLSRCASAGPGVRWSYLDRLEEVRRMSRPGVNAMPGRPEGEMVPHANEDELREAAHRHEVTTTEGRPHAALVATVPCQAPGRRLRIQRRFRPQRNPPRSRLRAR